MKRNLFFLILFFGFYACLKAQVPAGYYNAANGLTGEPLLEALHNIISNDVHTTYSGLWNSFKSTDARLDSTNKVWDIYSYSPNTPPKYSYTFTVDQCGEYNGEGDCYNREHLWPQSWFNESTNTSKPRTDLHHIYPTDGWVNGQRGNNPFAKVKTSGNPQIFKNGAKLGASATPGYTGMAYEPVDEYKGDIARAMLYMSVRYHDEDQNWESSNMTDKSVLKPWAITLLLQWHQEDPVSQKEISRNDSIYVIQSNRNPFIDNPDFALMIWDPTWGINNSESVSCKVSPNPVKSGGTIRIASADADKLNVEMYDLCGRKIDVQPMSNGTVVEVAMPSSMQQGVYFMSIAVAGQKPQVVKVVVN